MLRALLSKVTVVPVLTLHDAAHAVPLAEALCAAGLTVLEITLRTPAALAAIEAVRHRVPGAVVGAGTVVSAEQLAAAVGAGSQFLVSPGFSLRLAEQARTAGVPLLPASRPSWAITASVRPGSPLTSPTAERWSTHRPWPRTRARARRNSMIGRRSG